MCSKVCVGVLRIKDDSTVTCSVMVEVIISGEAVKVGVMISGLVVSVGVITRGGAV